MQRVGNLKEQFLSFENLYMAFKKAYRGTKNYSSYQFAYNADRELLTLQNELKNKEYVPGNYGYFTIYDPKERIISVALFRDRVVHHALVNVLEPVYEKRFIFDSYATRKEKGTHKAILKAQQIMRNNRWYLKMDVRKYFDSINHGLLNQIIARKIKDKFVLDLCKIIISKGGDGITGLPIGNLTSQFFANMYLDVFDHYMKDELMIKNYIRYMDDFCVFSDDKFELKKIRSVITEFLHNKLMLEVKTSATLINSRIHGLPFLGVRIFPSMVRHKKENFRRSFNKLKKNQWLYAKDSISYETYHSSMQSLTSHLNYYGNNLLKSELYNGMVSKTGLTA